MGLPLNGYVDLPPGKIAAIVTYLEMRQRPVLAPPVSAPVSREGWSLEPLRDDLARYRDLFRRVGEPWLWFSRLVMSEDALRRILDDPRVAALALRAADRDIGLLELDFRSTEQCELAYFGLVPDTIGAGWGRVLMHEALRRAWAQPIRRLWVHTCTLDHPRALGFYMRSGFRPYRRSVEIADDPRLKGYLSPSAGPHMPALAEAARPRATARAALARWTGRGRRA
jgi:GNAT superfamily N-acetyltransferase